MPDLDKAVDLARNLAGILALVFYVAIVLWTYKDARRRIDDPILIATAVACSMLPIVGVLVYMMLRPPEYLDDVRERELEIRAMERTLGMQERCPNCRSHIEANYLACPICMYKLRQPCITCEQPLDPRWSMCPFCETAVAGSEPVLRDSPRSSRASASPRTAPATKASSSGSTRTPRASGASSVGTASKPARSSSKSEPAASKPKTSRPESKRDVAGIDTEPLSPSESTMAMTTPKNDKDN